MWICSNFVLKQEIFSFSTAWIYFFMENLFLFYRNIFFSKKYFRPKIFLPLVNLKGTTSGVLNVFPCSKATPKSICTNSAVALSINIFCACLSPSPTIYPIFWPLLFKNMTVTHTHYRITCYTSCISQSLFKPFCWIWKIFQEKVMKNRMKIQWNFIDCI